MGVRITGIDTPLGGISWEYTEAEKNSIQEIFFFLESKRLDPLVRRELQRELIRIQVIEIGRASCRERV